jgi:hypothetical protein
MGVTEQRQFGRLVEFDQKSRDFNIRAVTPAEPRSYTWGCAANLDQKRTSECVAFSWVHEAIAKPKVRQYVDDATAHEIYARAQQLDEWPGEDYDGTSVLAGVKAAKEFGFIQEYRWAFNYWDGITGVSRHGPGVIGINWLSDMMDTDPSGYIHYSGPPMGGHAILVRGVDLRNKRVLLHNSWGREWGGTARGPGTAWLSFTDLEQALKDDGDFCIPVIRL